jgi:aspartyl-tRNA(Asn)/glutamyl-tRNA(Gln) amidotransferase subunit A
MPTVRRTARPISEVEADFGNHVSKYLSNTSVGNYLNLCGISLPSDLDGLGRPIGAMILAPAFGDDLVLSIGVELQASGMLPLHTPEEQKQTDE